MFMEFLAKTPSSAAQFAMLYVSGRCHPCPHCWDGNDCLSITKRLVVYQGIKTVGDGIDPCQSYDM